MDKTTMFDLAELHDHLRRRAQNAQRDHAFGFRGREAKDRAFEEFTRWADALEEAMKGLTDGQGHAG